MTGRPCKPDADFTRLWRLLLPGTPVPACGTGGGADNTPNEPDATPATMPAITPTALPGRTPPAADRDD